MSGFTSQALEKRLGELNNSAQTIQTFSLWLIHHRKHHKTIVQTWFKELKKANKNRKLTFMYLANDVIQNSRKKGPEFTTEFASILKPAFANVAHDADEKTWKGLDRILSVWSERNIYDSNQVNELCKVISVKKNSSSLNSSRTDEPLNKSKLKLESNLKKGKNENDFKRLKNSHKTSLKNNSNSVSLKTNNEKKVEDKIKLNEEVNNIIDPDLLINALQDLENSASSDACVREKIASLPPEVSDASLLDKIHDKDAAKKLFKQVDEACAILSDYNNRLAQELEERKKISIMLSSFVKNQKVSLANTNQRLNEFKEKLKKVNQVRNELKSHLQNLPDLSLLPSITGGLAPLPSAGDLFSIAAAKSAFQKSSLGSSSSASPNTASPADYEIASTDVSNSNVEDNHLQVIR